MSRLKAIIKSWSGSSFVRNAGVLSSGAVIAQALGLLSTPLVTRIYSPSELGAYGIVVAYSGFSSVVVTLRYELELPNEKDDTRAVALMLGITAMCLLNSGIATALFYLLVRLEVLSSVDTSAWSLAIVFGLTFFTAMFLVARLAYVRDSRYKEVRRLQVAQSVARNGCQLGAGMWMPFWPSLAAGDLLGRMLYVGASIHGLMGLIGRQFNGAIRIVVKVLSDNRQYALVLLPSGILNNIRQLVVVPLIAVIYGGRYAGYYFIVSRFGFLMLAVVGGAVGDVFQVECTKVRNDGADELRRLLRTTKNKLLTIGLLCYGPVIVISPFVLVWFLGDEWSAAKYLLAIIGPWSIAALVGSPLTRLFLVTKKLHYLIIYDVAALSSGVLTLLLSWHMRWSFELACLLLSISQAAAYVLLYWLLVQSVKRMSVGNDGAVLQ